MSKFNFKDLFDFERMITPKIIRIIYIILLVVIVLVGLGMIISGLNAYYGGGGQVFAGLMFLVLAPLAARIYCELLIVMFKIYEKLSSIDGKLDQEKTSE